ncbi:MAG: hypothetical protein N4A40_13030 [Tissierellales bacterium]|jgi:hypothetical protein|nr:hypothetical protein [Tissierellales bacterium]
MLKKHLLRDNLKVEIILRKSDKLNFEVLFYYNSEIYKKELLEVDRFYKVIEKNLFSDKSLEEMLYDYYRQALNDYTQKQDVSEKSLESNNILEYKIELLGYLTHKTEKLSSNSLLWFTSDLVELEKLGLYTGYKYFVYKQEINAPSKYSIDLEEQMKYFLSSENKLGNASLGISKMHRGRPAEIDILYKDNKGDVKLSMDYTCLDLYLSSPKEVLDEVSEIQKEWMNQSKLYIDEVNNY